MNLELHKRQPKTSRTQSSRTKTAETKDPPAVLQVRLDYADGTTDFIENLAEGFYGWRRDRPQSPGVSKAYTANGMAFLLFRTALSQGLSEYSEPQRKAMKLIKLSGAVSRDKR